MSILTPFPIPDICHYCSSKKFHKHGTRERHVIEQGVKTWHLVQRFLCIDDDCGKAFTLLLPNMLPHKHYAAPVIEQVLQNQEDPATPLHECEAEESTIRRWLKEFSQKLCALAASLELLANVSITRLVTPLQRVYNILDLLDLPPDQSRLAWAFFLAHPT